MNDTEEIIQKSAAKKSIKDFDSSIIQVKELLSKGYSIAATVEILKLEKGKEFTKNEITAIRNLSSKRKVKEELNEKIVSHLPEMSMKEEMQIIEIKEAITEGYDRDFICAKFNISKSKFYRIHAVYGRFFLPGKELNEQIKDKKKLNYKDVKAIKNEYEELDGRISYRALSELFGWSISDVMNVLTFKKHRNIGKKYNSGIKSINDSRVRKMEVIYKKKGIDLRKDNQKPVVINKFYNNSCEAFMDSELISKNQKVDMILFSPPYNIGRKYHKYKDSIPKEVYLKWMVDLHRRFDKILAKDRVVLLNLSYSSKDPSLPYKVITEIEENTNFSVADTIIWEKPGCTTNSSAFNRLDRIVEPIFVLARKNEMKTFHLNAGGFTIGKNGQKYSKTTIRNKIYCKNGKSKAGNISTYSVDLIKNLIRIYGKKGDLIFDPFMGTGTTGVGSLMSGCNFVGTEISEEQVEHSNQRIIKPIRVAKLNHILNQVNSTKSSNKNGFQLVAKRNESNETLQHAS